MKFWKKVLASVTAGVLCVGGVGLSGVESVLESMGTVLSASASVPYSYDGTYGDLYYNVTDEGEIEIIGCDEYATTVEIPAEINGKSVTSIGAFVFSGCTSLTEITIPDSVTSIGAFVFSGCTSLKNVYVSDINAWFEIDFHDFNSNPMCNGADFYCNGELVTEVAIPDSMDSIGNYVFAGCISLTEITIPDSVTSIGVCVFSGCTSLTEITIPDSVTSIGGDAFSSCTSLTEITIPDSVTSIGSYAFRGCTSLTEITIPNSVTSIINYTFENCTSLKSITFLGSKTGIEENAFRNCDADMKFIIEDTYGQEGEVASVATNVTQLTVKHKEGKIPAGVYTVCKRLKEVTLEEGITLIEDDAFAICDNLEKIVIPKSVTCIGYTAFTYDTNLTMYGYKDTYAERYAEMLGFPFVALDDSDTPPITTTTTTITTTTTTTETTTFTTAATGIAGGIIYGDINLDGQVDITDVILLNRYCSGTVSLNKNATKNADCDGDKEVSSNDAVVLLQFLVHIVSSLPHSA